MSEHTREPWAIGITDKWVTVVAHNEDIAQWKPTESWRDECIANARRIVACVNACVGIDTETLENRIKYTFTDIEKRNKELEAQLAVVNAANEQQREIIQRLNDAESIVSNELLASQQREAELSRSMMAASNWIKNCSTPIDAAHELDKALSGVG